MEKFEYSKHLSLKNKYNKLFTIISYIRLLLFIAFVLFIFISSQYKIGVYLSIVTFFLFVFMIIFHDKIHKKLMYNLNCLKVIENYENKNSGKWCDELENDVDISDKLLIDLDIVGASGLYNYLNVCKTLGSKKKLVKMLSNVKLSGNDLLENQFAIKEICNNNEFIIDFLVNLKFYENQNIDLEGNFKILTKKMSISLIILFVPIFLISGLLFLVLFCIMKLISLKLFFNVFICVFLINYIYFLFNKSIFFNIDDVCSDYFKLFDLFNVVLRFEFKSKKMLSLKEKIRNGYLSMKKLCFINDLNNLRNNILSSFIFNGLFSINYLIVIFYYYYIKKNSRYLMDAIISVEEIEVLLSLSTIGIIRDDVVLPELTKEVKLEVVDLKHPLLPNNVCISNNFSTTSGINVITGSNMGGKTSFIRTIGINLILMNAGTFVCASSFKCCYLKIFTSIRIEDNISKGISTFYAELLRIKKALDFNGNKIVLIDEIFKGTNYKDRIYGAKEVIKKLDNKETILFITTHDFELCDIENKNIHNYHFKEFYKNDKINFDYKIKKGKCNSTNAKYLMKKLGIID